MATLDPKTQKEGNSYSYSFLAEQRLAGFELNVPNFPCILLSLSMPGNSIRIGVDIPSVLLLKNLIKKHWAVTLNCFKHAKIYFFRTLIQPFSLRNAEILLSVIYLPVFQNLTIMFVINLVK